MRSSEVYLLLLSQESFPHLSELITQTHSKWLPPHPTLLVTTPRPCPWNQWRKYTCLNNIPSKQLWRCDELHDKNVVIIWELTLQHPRYCTVDSIAHCWSSIRSPKPFDTGLIAHPKVAPYRPWNLHKRVHSNITYDHMYFPIAKARTQWSKEITDSDQGHVRHQATFNF